MLKHLSIQNYALIDKVDIAFSDGLTIITGETGAGKSILLGALGLIAGNRADSKSLQDITKKCIVEASFKIDNYSLVNFFEDHNLDYDKECIIRREITIDGKSRAFINDTPVTLIQLKDLAERLIDIHSQHQTLTLNGNEFQLSIVDVFAKNSSLLDKYESEYKQLKITEKKLELLVEAEFQTKKELDYIQFQFDELDAAQFKENEQINLEQELEILNNSEDIKINLSKAFIGLDGGEQNIISSINEIKIILNNYARFKPEIEQVSKRINSVYIEVKDLSKEIEALEQDIIYDASKIEELTERLDTIYRLQQKHQVKTVEELILIKNELSDKLLQYDSLETEILKTKKELSKINDAVLKTASEISTNRKKSTPKIEKEISALLSSLSMPNANLKIDITDTETLNAKGKDKVVFLFSANKGSEFKELKKVASGGELSRLMLSIKSLLAKLTALPTIIFDEIDTGVSGEVADKVGMIMNQMATSMQVITITHLPQIASKGKSHLFVFKDDKQNKTYSSIKTLSTEERIHEIAKLLSAGKPTTSAINTAKELLNN